MTDRVDLEAAAAAGIIAADRVDPLYAFLSARKQTAAPAPTGEEDLRFIRNFHDVFLAIGIALLAIGMAVAIATFVSSLHETGEYVRAAYAGGGAAIGAGVLWVLAETFARKRRLFLPAIALCLGFVAFITFAACMAYTMSVGAALGAKAHFTLDDSSKLGDMPLAARAGIIFVALSAFASAALYYWRFRLPFSMGVTGACAALLLGAIVFAAAPAPVWALRGPLMLVLGILLFLAGVWFDARDPARATRLSDNGFWLHMAAAPLVLNGALMLVSATGILNDYRQAHVDVLYGDAGADAAQHSAVLKAFLTLAIVFVLGFISLLINRRALIVSALVTTGIAIGVLMNATGLGAGGLIAGTMVTLGGFVLIIGASWHTMRRALLGWIRPNGALARIFPPEQAA